jgi:hemerythrin
MALIPWSNDLSVGVEAMDGQHKRLVKAVNDLHEAMAAGHSKEIMGGLLDSLVRYTREHFVSEEALLMRSRYPKLTPHRVLHNDLTKKVEDYVRRFKSGEIAMSVGLMDFLRDWLTFHIKQEDKAYGVWLNQQGVH